MQKILFEVELTMERDKVTDQLFCFFDFNYLLTKSKRAISKMDQRTNRGMDQTCSGGESGIQLVKSSVHLVSAATCASSAAASQPRGASCSSPIPKSPLTLLVNFYCQHVRLSSSTVCQRSPTFGDYILFIF